MAGQKTPTTADVQGVVEKIYRGETSSANLQQYTPQSIKDVITPSIQAYKNDQLLKEMPKTFNLSGLIMKGLNKETIEHMVSGGPHSETLAANLGKALGPAAVSQFDASGDKVINAADFKINNPELRQAFLNSYDKIQQELVNQGSMDKALEAIRQANPPGLLAQVVNSADEAIKKRVNSELQGSSMKSLGLDVNELGPAPAAPGPR